MAFRIARTEQRFLLNTIAGLPALATHDRYAQIDADMIDAIVDGAADFAEQEYAPLLRIGDTVGARWNDGVVTMPPGFRDAYQAFVENGWGTLFGDPQYGGQGSPFTLATVVMEDLGTANMGFSLINMLTAGAVEALSVHGTPAQKAAWLPKLITGEWPGTMNLTEPQAGSDVGALRTKAEPAGDGQWLITGQKIFITFGEHDLADNIIHLVLARTPGAAAGTKGISLFLVPKFRLDGEGRPTISNDVRCASIEHKLGIHASPTCVMSYGDAGACLGELIGPEHGGIAAMFTMMNNARLNVGSQGVQVAERATQAAIEFAISRIQSPRADGSSEKASVAIIDHPDVRRMLMRMSALTQAARALLYYATGQADLAHLGDAAAKARVNLLTPLVKAYGTDVGCEVASLGVQIHGGMGFIEETGAAQHYRDARITPIYEGTNGIQAADLVGRKLTKDGGDALFRLIEDIEALAEGSGDLQALCNAVREIGRWMLDVASPNDRLAGSYPFLTMTAVMVAGGLMARQLSFALDAADGDYPPQFLENKRAIGAFYLGSLVPEATGLKRSAMLGSAHLYELSAASLLAGAM